MVGLQPITILAASAGILGSAWISGGQALLSVLAIPGLLSTSSEVPTEVLAQQWAGIYNRGKAIGPQTAAVSLLGYGYMVYERNSQNRSWALFVGAAALTVAIVPFTRLVMHPTNQKLLDAAAGVTSLDAVAVRNLFAKWRVLNIARSLIPLSGALLGMYALLGPS